MVSCIRILFLLSLLSGICSSLSRAQVWVHPVFSKNPLIKQGHLEAGVNHQDKSGDTPLMLAVNAGDLAVIQYLLPRGADFSVKNSAGKTVLDLARAGGKPEIYKLLNAYVTEHPGRAAYYAGKKPALKIISGQNQSGSPGWCVPHSLVVSVTDENGNPLADAPVKFTADHGGLLLTSATSPLSADLILRSGYDGQCAVCYQLPNEPGVASSIVATAGLADQTAQVTFHTLTNDGTNGGSATPFDASIIEASGNSDGTTYISWTNHTEDESYNEISFRQRDGSWAVAMDVPPHTTSAMIPRDPPGPSKVPQPPATSSPPSKDDK
jgi:hypothetical protein